MVAYSFKKRFIRPIEAGLGILPVIPTGRGRAVPAEFVIEPGSIEARPFDPVRDLDPPVHPKRQTIRAHGKRRHARPGETLQLYYAMRHPKLCRKIGEAHCSEVVPVSIVVGDHSLVITSGKDTVKGGLIHAFARLDGFTSGEDMLEFWKKEHGLGRFEGVMIRWEPLT